MIKTEEELMGLEYDWLACDADGCVALFTTAGSGYAPVELRRDTDLYLRTIELILTAPASTEAVTAPIIKEGLVNIWREMACRGFFSFDGVAHMGTYDRESVPRHPARLSELPPEIAEVVGRIRLVHVRFAEAQRVTPDLLKRAEELA